MAVLSRRWATEVGLPYRAVRRTRKAVLVGDEIAEVTQIHTYVFNIEVDISMYLTLWLILAIFSPANELHPRAEDLFCFLFINQSISIAAFMLRI
jgi:hypothetical protein